MTDSRAGHDGGRGPASGDGEPIPFMQRFLDNHFLLLFLGVAVPSLLYLVWGIMEVVNIPLAQ